MGSGITDTLRKLKKDEFPVLILAQGRGRSCDVTAIIQGQQRTSSIIFSPFLNYCLGKSMVVVCYDFSLQTSIFVYCFQLAFFNLGNSEVNELMAKLIHAVEAAEEQKQLDIKEEVT